MKSKTRSGSKQRNFDVKVFNKKVFLLFGRICNPATLVLSHYKCLYSDAGGLQIRQNRGVKENTNYHQWATNYHE